MENNKEMKYVDLYDLPEEFFYKFTQFCVDNGMELSVKNHSRMEDFKDEMRKSISVFYNNITNNITNVNKAN